MNRGIYGAKPSPTLVDAQRTALGFVDCFTAGHVPMYTTIRRELP